MNTSDPPPPQDSVPESEPLLIGAGINFSDPNSSLAPFYLRTSHVLAVAFLGVVFLFFGVATPLAHTDIWAHLKYGEWIVAHRALPEHELFSPFSDAQEPYWNFQWLSQAIFYLVYHAGALLAGGDELRQMAGGVEILRTLHGVLITLKVALVMMAIRRSTKSMPLALAGAVLLVVLTMPTSRVQRPQVFAEVFFAFLIWWVSGPRLSRATWLALPLLFVLWANCHGSFAVGLLFFGLFWFGRVVELAWNRSPAPRQSWWTSSWIWQGLIAMLVSLLAIGLLNPHGFELFPGVLKLARHPNIRTLGEWGPLDFSQPFGGHWSYLATVMLALVSQAVSPRPLALSRLLVLLAFAIGPLYQQRMSSWWVMLLPWIVAPLWASTAALLPRFWLRFRGTASFRKTLIAALLGLISVTWSGFFQLVIGHDPLPLSASVTHATLWPMAMELKEGGSMPDLAAALKTYPQGRFQGRMFVQDSLADFLLWSLPEKADMLVYNHAHVFPEAIWQDQLTMLSARPGWASALARYRVNLIALDPVYWPDLAAKLRENPDWIVILDEGATATHPGPVSPGTMKVMIAVRKTPI